MNVMSSMYLGQNDLVGLAESLASTAMVYKLTRLSPMFIVRKELHPHSLRNLVINGGYLH